MFTRRLSAAARQTPGGARALLRTSAVAAMAIIAACATTLEGGALVETPAEQRVRTGSQLATRLSAVSGEKLLFGVTHYPEQFELLALVSFVATIPDARFIVGGNPAYRFDVKQARVRRVTPQLSIRYSEVTYTVGLVHVRSGREISRSEQTGLCSDEGGPGSSPAPCPIVMRLLLTRAMEKLT